MSEDLPRRHKRQTPAGDAQAPTASSVPEAAPFCCPAVAIAPDPAAAAPAALATAIEQRKRRRRRRRRP